MNNYTFLEAVKAFYRNWNNFDGRATRAEFWYPVLYAFVVSCILGLFGKFGAVLSGIFGLVNLIPSIAVAIRRMHDIGKSGWWILISLIPVIGTIWYIILCVTPSKESGYKA
ncbi:MAG: DUF805 domain-containing protein [Duncaniella sp.]|nr:DUF805 domain-containing protein [Duncaniella sp.]